MKTIKTKSVDGIATPDHVQRGLGGGLKKHIRQKNAELPALDHPSLPRPSCVHVFGSICSAGRTA